ncbi:unnamed protein product, partial [marine sediment metagenome]
MTGLVMRKVISGGVLKLERVQVVPRGMSGGVLKLERVQVICPACGEQVEAVAGDGQVKGYCAVAKQYVNFLVETQGVRTDNDSTAEVRAKLSAIAKKRWQDPEYRAKQSASHIGKHPTAETRTKILATQSTEEHRAKQSAATKKLWQDPEYRAKQRVTRMGKHHTAEAKAKLSAASKKRWEDPEYQAKQIATHTVKHSTALMGKHLTAETKAKIS